MYIDKYNFTHLELFVIVCYGLLFMKWRYKAMFNKTEYQRNYRKEKLKRVPLDLTIKDYKRLKSHTETTSETVNGFIKRAIEETIENDNKK